LPQHSAERFFLWVHLSDPHEPYQAKGAPPDVEVSLDGEPLGRWSLTSKETFTLDLDLSPGTHRITWTPIREPRADDLEQTALRLNVKGRDEIAGLLADPESAPPAEMELREPWSLQLEIPGPEPQRLQLPFSGWIASPPQSEVLESYRAEVAYVDTFLGRLRSQLEDQGLEEDTLWVVVTDHGEGLFRHGARGHVIHSREDQLRILWLMKGPGLPSGLRVAEPGILTEDIAPTVIDLVGLPAPEGLSGISRTDCWRARGCAGRSEWWAFGVRAEPLEIASVAGYRWPFKVLWDRKRSRTYLYHLEQDPFEQTNLLELRREGAIELPDEALELRQRIGLQINELEGQVAEAAETPFDDETLDALRELGYLSP
jgi:arylsulfatase A-like enzyme